MVEIFLFKSRFFIQVKNSFFNVRVSIFKSRSFLFNLRCFNSSRDFFFMSRFLSQVEDFFFFMSRFVFQVEDFVFHVEICISSRVFSHVENFFMSRFLFQVENFFFHVEICISSRGIFRIFSCRDLYFKSSFLSHVENFFMLTFFFSRGECVFIASREFCSLRGLSSGHFAIQGRVKTSQDYWYSSSFGIFGSVKRLSYQQSE